jgi:hypothetical protein
MELRLLLLLLPPLEPLTDGGELLATGLTIDGSASAVMIKSLGLMPTLPMIVLATK